MSPLSKITVTGILVLALVGLGTADALLSNGKTLPAVLQASDSGSTVSVAQGVAKKKGPDVIATIAASGFEATATPESSLLEQVIPTGTPVQYRVLLKDGDRAGSLTWVETPSAKIYFAALKEALLGSLSNRAQDLQDTTVHLAGEPVVNTLTFRDPTISDEKVTLARTQERMYEIHEAKGKEQVMEDLLQQLVAR